MSHLASTDRQTFQSQSQSFSEQPELNLSEAFEIEDIEDEVEIICNTSHTIPSSFKVINFKFLMSDYAISRPLHRRIFELRFGISLNPSLIKKQKKMEEIKSRLKQNRDKFNPKNQSSASHRDKNSQKEKKKEENHLTFLQLDDNNRNEKKTLNCDTLIERDPGPSMPLSKANLQAFMSLNNPDSIPQQRPRRPSRGANSSYFPGLTPNP
ncbi:hypothetical protein DFH28DRAFT_1108003 [Melampsora americana]|nr:hypothetical protein DFH28DRAFT_1108003 [Melampsora americana]